MSKKYLKTESFEQTVSTSGIKKIKLENISGNILIKQGIDSSKMTVEATKEIKVRKKDLDKPIDEIEINIDTDDNMIRIKTEYNAPNRKTIFNFNMGNKASVDYVITVPPGIDLGIENVNGNITSDKLDNDLSIDLVNGKTEITNYSGILQCEIVNGSFTGEILNTGGVGISTVNGSVTLNLNNYINAELWAETVNGKISDSNLMIKEIEKKKRKFKGYLEAVHLIHRSK
ncbi:MAG: hypothetical protein R2942_00280 [Ignavibacteria bacterium]